MTAPHRTMTVPLDTPTERDRVLAAAKALNFEISADHEGDYLELCAKTDAICSKILAEPDYLPVPNTKQYPRSNVHLPDHKDNPLRAWAWRAEAVSLDNVEGSILNGKTVVLKDTICMAEVPLLFGTDAFEGYTPMVDATLVSRILENGGRILGKAACENFSHGATSSSSPYGPVENPYAKGFTTGGSSSGCGALVGSGQVDMAIGGDQGGSIRIPASYCGLVGLKPTFGLVPYTGVLSSESGVDHVGPMAQNVQDTAALLQAIAGYDGIDDRQLGAHLPSGLPDYRAAAAGPDSLRGVTVGVVEEAFAMKTLAPSVKALNDAAIRQLETLGATVKRVSIPTFPLTTSLSHVINKFASGLTRQGRQVGRRGLYLNDYWSQLLPWDQHKYDKAKYFVTGTAMSSEYGWVKYPTAYGRAMNLARKMRDEFDEALKTCDILITPTCPTPPRRHIPPGSGPLIWAEHAPGAASITAATNLTGHPSMTLPVGLAPPMSDDIQSDADQDVLLPIGMMLMGKAFDECALFKVAGAYERSVDWKTVRP